MNKKLVVDLINDVHQWAKTLPGNYRTGKFWRSHSIAASNTLIGLCAIVSSELWCRLRENGIEARKLMASSSLGSHVFLLIDDYIVDPTVSQMAEYKFKDYVILHEKEAKHWYHIKNITEFKNPADLLKKQIKWKWPPHQLVREESLRLEDTVRI